MKCLGIVALGSVLWCASAHGQAPDGAAIHGGGASGSRLEEAGGKLPGAPAARPVLPSNDAARPVTGTAAQTITIDDVVRMAQSRSPRLRAAEALTTRAAGAVQTAGAYANPSVEVFEGPQYARPIATPGVPGLLQHYAGYQPVEVPAERRARREAARLAQSSSQFGQAGVALSVAAEAKHAFYTVLRRREEVEHQQENLQLVQDLRRRVEVEVNVGEKGRLELTRAEAEVARARFGVRSAQIGLANATAALRVAIAAPLDAALDPQGSLDARIALPPLEQLRDQVLRTHPAVAQSATDVQTAQAMLRREKALRVPQPTLFAEFENQPDLRYWRAGFTVPLPLWDRRRGQIQEAKAVIAVNEATLDQRRLELVSATERGFEQYQLADQQAQSLESGELRAAQSAVEAAKAAYRFGERGIVEVLDAQRVLQAVRDDLLDAQYARQSALIDLEELGAVTPGGRP